MNPRPVVLTIAGFDPSGGAGLLADIRTIAAFDCFPVGAITSITYQNTTGVFGAVHQTADVLNSQLAPILEDFDIAAIKTGMLPTPEIIEAVIALCESHNLPPPIVDPVMVSTSGHDLIDDRAFSIMRDSLLPCARLVTPNIPEAERLTGSLIRNAADLQLAAQRIRELGARAVLVKGGHHAFQTETNGPLEAIDVLVDEAGAATTFRSEFITVGDVHGSGCTLSAGIAAGLALGMTLSGAITAAKDFVRKAIRNSEDLGRGARPLFGMR